MKILHLNSFDDQGGAAIAANRLHQALLQQGLDSRMTVLVKTCSDKTITRANPCISCRSISLAATLDKIPLLAYPSAQRPYPFTPAGISWGGSGVHRIIRTFDPDIVHLHWTGSGMLSIKNIGWISRHKPVVWTLHDAWAFTGGCHYPSDCYNYHTTCGRCPVLGSSSPRDLSAKILTQKERLWSRSNIVCAAPSLWMKNLCNQSRLFSENSTVQIPNGVAVNQTIASRETVCAKFRLDSDKKFILMLAHSLADERKGANLFFESLSCLNDIPDVEVLTIGQGQASGLKESPYPVHHLGYVSSPRDILALYAAADVFAAPAKEDNFPNTILESMSVGTPVVAFAQSGGAAEMINHKGNGYLADEINPGKLADGLTWILTHEAYPMIRHAAAQKIQQCYTLDLMADRYRELYETIIQDQRKGHPC